MDKFWNYLFICLRVSMLTIKLFHLHQYGDPFSVHRLGLISSKMINLPHEIRYFTLFPFSKIFNVFTDDSFWKSNKTETFYLKYSHFVIDLVTCVTFNGFLEESKRSARLRTWTKIEYQASLKKYIRKVGLRTLK